MLSGISTSSQSYSVNFWSCTKLPIDCGNRDIFKSLRYNPIRERSSPISGGIDVMKLEYRVSLEEGRRGL